MTRPCFRERRKSPTCRAERQAFTSFPPLPSSPPDLHTPLTDAVSAPSLPSTSPEGAFAYINIRICIMYTSCTKTRICTHVHAPLTYTHVCRRNNYRPGLSARYRVPWQNFILSFPRVNIALKGGVIVVPALRRGAKLAGAPAANESAERSWGWQSGGGVSGVTTSLLRPITHARRGDFRRER